MGPHLCCRFLFCAMVGLQAHGPIAALFAVLIVLSRVSAEYNTTHNSTLPANATGHFDPAKYRLPLPIDSAQGLAEGEASNATTHHNVTLNSTMPTAGHYEFQQSAKYILPMPNNTMGVSATVEGARVESADSNTSTSVVASPTSASAKIESVPGFVKAQGQNFAVNGKAAYFAGTNAW